MNSFFTPKEALLKLEHFCAYQERCHAEVVAKLYSLKMTSDEIDSIIVQLIENNFLNETRFACSFARGKHRIKFWGKIRITNELKARQISPANITLALKEISPEEYEDTFSQLSERCWNSIHEKNILKKRKKFCDYMLRRGYESFLVYDKVKELENN
jgi:regulatory protein